MISIRFLLGKDAVVWRWAVLAGSACLVACLSIVFLRVFHQKPLVLPGEAFMLVVLLSTRAERRWASLAAVFLGYSAGGFLVGHDRGTLMSALVVSLPLVGGVLAAYGLLRRFAPPLLDLARPRDLAVFMVASALAAPVATLCVCALATHWLNNDDGPLALWRWAAANALGMLTLTPGFLILGEAVARIRSAPLPKPGLVALGVLVLVSLAAFGDNPYGLRYLVPPALALVGIYLEFLGVALGGLFIALIATAGH